MLIFTTCPPPFPPISTSTIKLGSGHHYIRKYSFGALYVNNADNTFVWLPKTSAVTAADANTATGLSTLFFSSIWLYPLEFETLVSPDLKQYPQQQVYETKQNVTSGISGTKKELCRSH